MIDVRLLYKILAVVVGINVVLVLATGSDFCYFSYYADQSIFKHHLPPIREEQSTMVRPPDFYAAVFFRKGSYNGVKFESDYYGCSGTIIAYQWILTAAQCLNYIRHYSIPLPNTYVKSRLSSLDDPIAETHTIRYYIVHEEFFKNYEADIGLIRVHAPPLLSDIVAKPPLLLAEEKHKYENGKRCLIRGISKDSKSYQQTKLKIVGTEECLQGSNVYRLTILVLYSVAWKIHEMKKSFSIDANCSITGNPAVFIKVSYFYKWIKRKCTENMCWTT